MEKKRFVSLALASMLSMGMLSGCGSEDLNKTGAVESSNTEVVDEVKKIDEKYFGQYVDVPETKIFEAGEHVFFVRYNYIGSAENFTSGRVDVPEGYQILEIENYNEYVGYGSQTSGVDIWYINTEPVLVEPVYKNELRLNRSCNGYYDYANFGTVIELEESYSSEKVLTK